MARIRTIKPEFFRHHDLYEAELASKLPLRLSFAGLITACDREGRFKWDAYSLKLDCLPYDKIDFTKVLDELFNRKFVFRYEIDGQIYGCIPTFLDHQRPNSHEAKSIIPPPDENELCTFMHMHARALKCIPEVQSNDAREEGKGKEWKRNDSNAPTTRKNKTEAPEEFLITEKMKTYAKEKAPEDIDLERETEKFLLHHKSKGDRFSDWDSAWMKWIHNSVDWKTYAKKTKTEPPKPEYRYEPRLDENGRQIGINKIKINAA